MNSLLVILECKLNYIHIGSMTSPKEITIPMYAKTCRTKQVVTPEFKQNKFKWDH